VTLCGEDIIKWLGVYLDRQLTFNHHVKQMVIRAEKTVNGLKMLANMIKELSQMHLRTLYISYVRP
ncbi:hypothetical protein BKA93DRAFT_713030, partial [Sparassis latifolia]